MSKDRSMYQIQYPKNCDGLTSLIGWCIERSGKDQVRLSDKRTASRLGVTEEKLAQLQAKLRSKAVFFCRRTSKGTRYSKHPFSDQSQTVSAEW